MALSFVVHVELFTRLIDSVWRSLLPFVFPFCGRLTSGFLVGVILRIVRGFRVHHSDRRLPINSELVRGLCWLKQFSKWVSSNWYSSENVVKDKAGEHNLLWRWLAFNSMPLWLSLWCHWFWRLSDQHPMSAVLVDSISHTGVLAVAEKDDVE